MGWNSGESLAATVIEATWSGLAKLDPIRRREALGKIIVAIEEHDGEFCWADWEDDAWWPDIRAYLLDAGDIAEECQNPIEGTNWCDYCEDRDWCYV